MLENTLTSLSIQDAQDARNLTENLPLQTPGIPSQEYSVMEMYVCFAYAGNQMKQNAGTHKLNVLDVRTCLIHWNSVVLARLHHMDKLATVHCCLIESCLRLVCSLDVLQVQDVMCFELTCHSLK